MTQNLPSRQALQSTFDKLESKVHRTAVLTSRLLDDMAGAKLFFKCENFQKMGAFKMRGATNAILSLSPEQRRAGVVTHSSGNFGQAVALAAANLGVSAYIVMPSNAPRVKVEAVKQYGGKITFCEPTIEAREEAASRIIANQDATFLHPSNQLEVILGNATAAIELLQDYPDLDVLVAPVGGGGLIAGTALAAYHFGQNCETLGAEPAEVDDAWRSLRSGSIETNQTTNTIADGLRTTLGDVNFPIIQELVGDIIRVEEEEIVQALRLIWERLKIVVEPSCAVALAAVLKAPDHFNGKHVGIIISGGNVDLNSLPF